jgi:hypothetical protein
MSTDNIYQERQFNAVEIVLLGRCFSMIKWSNYAYTKRGGESI